jgi:hypothetical protein
METHPLALVVLAIAGCAEDRALSSARAQRLVDACRRRFAPSPAPVLRRTSGTPSWQRYRNALRGEKEGRSVR